MSMTTELAQRMKAAALKAKQANDLYLEGKITLSECVVETKDYLDYSDNPNNTLALVEALAAMDAEPVADVVAWHKEGEERTCDIRWRRFDVAPGPLFAVAQPVMKDHQIRELVNELRDIAVEYHGTQQLRERISRTVRAAILNHSESARDMVEPVSQPYKLPSQSSDAVNEAAWKLHDTLTEHGPLNGHQFNNLKGCFYEALKIAMCNSPVIPGGWQLVPVEPTLEMIKSGANAASTGMLIPGMYRAMLAAAPQLEGK
ncbi:hypothetical protein [Escherichia coli]|uniref:hypothetical protein n=1 Tax=Escherichia coli TaxID=562 RepID=UPI001FCEC948|nr:hypothetical protein [Escherichia coli]